jgi:16S rRNA (uracil1498-N3)-methyltransferase
MLDADDTGSARLHVTGPLTPGTLVPLEIGQVHYLRAVMRMQPGDKVFVFNGHDGEALAEISALDKRKGDLKVLRQTRPQLSEPDIWLLFAPIRKARVDFIVEKATELGASRLLPVMTRRTQGGRVPVDRLSAIAREAAEQSERLTLPQLDEPVALEKIAAEWPASRRLIVCDETGTGGPIANVLAALPPGEPLAVLVGPEGGFAPGELACFDPLPLISRVSLGPRILRADTAVAAVLSVVQSVLGDWRTLGPRPLSPED